MIRIGVSLATLVLLAASVPPTANADPPPRVTIVAVFDPIRFGENDYVNGQLFGDGQAGQTVALEEAPPPYTTWTPVAQVAADAQSFYSFKLQPTETMQYRTSSQGTPSERVVQIDVMPRIAFKATPSGKSSVRYSGSVAPAIPGESVAIQRLDARGSWTTVANARLQGGGRIFQGRLRTRKGVVLRAFFASDGAHADAATRPVRVTPGAKAAGARAAAASCAAPAITRVLTKPASPVAGQAFTLRVTSTMTGGKLYAVDVLWGQSGQRDHLTLAPGFRESRVTFALRHRYKTRGAYRLTIKTYGATAGCRRASQADRPLLRVS